MPTSGNLLQWIAVTLLGLAVVMVTSAGMSVGGDPNTHMTFSAILTGRPILMALAALAVMWMVGYLDLRAIFRARGLANPVIWLLAASFVLCAIVLIPGVGKNVNGASRWLNIGNFSFQPSELAKWSLMIALAWWGAKRAGAMHSFFYGLLPGMIVLGAVCGIVLIEDLGTAVLIGAVGVILLLAAGGRIWQIALMVPPAAATVVLAVAHSPYRLRRLVAFTHPWDDPQGVGYHPIQSMLSIAGGQLTGRGLGNGIQKFGYLPEDTTDFLFAVICEELGVMGAVAVIGLYLALLWIGLGIVRDCKHPFGRLVGLGVLATIGLQAAMNIAVVTVVVPTKGIALPLLSNGGTGWVMCGAAIGLLVAIDRLNEVEASEQAEAQAIARQLRLDSQVPFTSVSASQFPAV